MTETAPNPLPNNVLLRDVTEADLPIFFDNQLDPAANRMAAFTAKDNLASIRVLQKCGFTLYGEDKEFSHSRAKRSNNLYLN